LAANRQEFHPSVAWLRTQEVAGKLRRDENPTYEIVARFEDSGLEIRGRTQADELRLMELYREWEAAGPDERRGHGNKYNGDVYYGAFRGRTHLDCGGTMTVLFGPGELRDGDGLPAAESVHSRELGGVLLTASPGEQRFTSLPYRLPGGAPYVVVFFEEYQSPPPTPSPAAPARPVDADALGWRATVHGVSRIEDPQFSRGQAVVHLVVTDRDLAPGGAEPLQEKEGRTTD
jgi:hypothetical protein